MPVEDVRPGDLVRVGLRTGWRRVIRVDRYDTTGLQDVEGFVVVYEPGGPGQAWENRAGAKGVVSFFARTEAALAIRPRGHKLTVQRTFGRERTDA